MVVILLLNVMGVLSVGVGALLDKLCMVFRRMCVWCSCDPSEHIDGPFIGFVYVCMSEVIFSFRSLESWIIDRLNS